MAITMNLTQGSVAVTSSSTAGIQIPRFQLPSVSITLASLSYFGGILSIGTSEEDITFTDVSSPRRLFMVNLDATNYVKWGPKSGGAMIEMGRLYPDGSQASFDIAPSGVTLRMIANTAACNVLFWLGSV